MYKTKRNRARVKERQKEKEIERDPWHKTVDWEPERYTNNREQDRVKERRGRDWEIKREKSDIRCLGSPTVSMTVSMVTGDIPEHGRVFLFLSG